MFIEVAYRYGARRLDGWLFVLAVPFITFTNCICISSEGPSGNCTVSSMTEKDSQFDHYPIDTSCTNVLVELEIIEEDMPLDVVVFQNILQCFGRFW
jgi:hypothetical protein